MRKDIEALSNSEPEALRKLRGAFARMMQIVDYRGYNYWAGIHGTPQYYCWHSPRPPGQGARRDWWHPSLRVNYDLWLPWHRAYLLYFEHYLRDQDPDVGLPWWDWSSNRSLEVGVPAAVSAEEVDGQSNPLYKAHIRATDYVPVNQRDQFDRDTFYSPARPSELRRKLLEVIEETIGNMNADRPVSDRLIMALRSIRQFGGDSGFSATLREIHDHIHLWTGGDMATVSTAAFVPAFWFHHSMIDRIWYLWQIENGVNNIPIDYLPVVLQPFGLTVSDVLDIAELGYEYAVSEVVVGGPG